MWKVSFGFNHTPRFELVQPSRGSVELGQVAFGLLKLDTGDTQAVGAFFEAYNTCWLYHNNRKVDPARFPALWPLERATMRAFVEQVLLVPAPEYWQLGLPPSRRFVAFYQTHPHFRETVQQRFHRLSLLPGIATRAEVFSWSQARFRKKATEWQEAWATRERDPEKLKAIHGEFDVFSWRYSTDDLLAVAWLELCLMAEHDITVRACRACGTFFVPWPPNTVYCPTCRRDTTWQQVRYHKKRERMSEEQRQKLRERQKLHKRKVRLAKRLYSQGKSVTEIAEAVGESEGWVMARLTGRRKP